MFLISRICFFPSAWLTVPAWWELRRVHPLSLGDAVPSAGPRSQEFSRGCHFPWSEQEGLLAGTSKLAWLQNGVKLQEYLFYSKDESKTYKKLPFLFHVFFILHIVSFSSAEFGNIILIRFSSQSQNQSPLIKFSLLVIEFQIKDHGSDVASGNRTKEMKDSLAKLLWLSCVWLEVSY